MITVGLNLFDLRRTITGVKIPLLYGFGMALASAVMTLVMYFAGLHDSGEKLSTAQWVGTIGGIAIGVAAFSLAMREKRANFPADEEWGYGNALGVGVLTALFGSLFGAVFAYLYFGIIHPGMSDVILEGQIAALEARGMKQAQIEQAEPMMRKWMSPVMLTVMQVFFGFLWGVVLSLIVAIFFRQRPAAAGAPPLPTS